MVIHKKNIGSTEPATKGDIEQLREDLQADMEENRAELTDLRQEMNSRFEEMNSRFAEQKKQLDDWARVLFDKIEGAIENRAIELGGARVADVSLLRDQVHQLDERVTTIERRHE